LIDLPLKSNLVGNRRLVAAQENGAEVGLGYRSLAVFIINHLLGNVNSIIIFTVVAIAT
jgi:hypothetical protein